MVLRRKNGTLGENTGKNSRHYLRRTNEVHLRLRHLFLPSFFGKRWEDIVLVVNDLTRPRRLPILSSKIRYLGVFVKNVNVPSDQQNSIELM